MSRFRIYFFSSLLFLIAACKPPLTPEALYGKWKYTNLESAKDDPVTVKNKLAIQQPSIEFTRKDSLTMIWGGEVFAKGKFRTDGNKIMFNQDLEGGRKYEYKFVVDEISDKKLIFETDGADVSKVTAVRE